ncbi:MAG: sigma-70 family RNA polymerase sigma factor [Chitinophagales bacterium]
MDTGNLTKADKDRIFNTEFLPHMDALYNFGFHLTLNEDDANDLVQETFLKAYRFISSYQQGTNAKAWLFKILKNGFINDYRRKTKQPVKVDYDDIAGYHDTDDEGHVEFLDLRHDLFQGMLGDEVTRALNELPVDFKTIILLCDIEEFSYEEISKIIDIPIGTVRSRLHRARNILKDKLKEYALKEGFKEKR